MRTHLAIGLVCGLLLSLGDVAGRLDGLTLGGEPPSKSIQVDVASGRTLTGELDAQTDRETLWLRWTRGSASIRQPISWDRVIRVHLGDQVLSGLDFARTFSVPEAGTARSEQRRQRELVLRGGPATMPLGRADSQATASKHEGRFGHEARRVQSLAIDVQVANWNSSVEVDGLVVDVLPLDAAGRVAPVRGTLEVDLIGSLATHARPGRTFPQIGRWTQTVEVSDFHRGGASLRLPFQQVHPESDFSVAPFGVVHARLSVPGEGVFEASASAVRIRPYSAIRDQLQRATGERFFPQEQTAAGLR